MFPEYLVNRWIGHTQKVAEAHYTQTLPSDFIDAYNAEKNVGKTVGEHAEMGCSGVEAAKKFPTESPTFHPSISMACNEMHCNSRTQKKRPIAGAGLEPAQPYGQGILNP